MKKHEKQTWSQIQVKGHARFVMRQIMRKGIPMGLIVTLGVFLSVAPSPWDLAKIFMCFGIGFGCISGEMEWKRCERTHV